MATRRLPRITRRHLIGGVAALAAMPRLALAAGAADLVLLGGEIHTVDANNRRTQALAIKGNQIAAVGSDDEMRAWIGRGTRTIHLEGRSVLPGINDSHLHLLMWALAQPPFAVDVTYPNVQSIADCATRVGEATTTRAPGEWITGWGWDQPYLSEKRPPTAADLDAVAPNHPVALTEFSGHAMWVNSAAMKLAGITRESTPPPGGVIVRDPDGNPTGLLFESAAWMVNEVIPAPTRAQHLDAIRAGMKSQVARGITSCTEPGLPFEHIAIYNELAAEDRAARMRVTALVRSPASTNGLEEMLQTYRALKSSNPAFLHLPGVKIMGDGIPTQNKTAWLNEPYATGGNGSLLIEGDDHPARVSELHRMIDMIHRADLQIGIHVTGDRSVDTAVAAIRAAQQAHPRPDPRHYLIHADLISDETIAQMVEGAIGANFNPEIKHLIADAQVMSLGPERAAREWPYKSALDAGIHVASSSDAPVTTGNWLQGIATCIDRRGKQSGQVSGPEQRIDLDAAIRTYTATGAWQDRAEDRRGSLEVGKLADLCVLDARLSSLPTERYAAVQNAMTLVDGVVAFDGNIL